MIADLMDSGFDFVAADFPDANRFTVHVLAALAEYERSLISERLKEALAAARARGVKCGRPSGFRSPRAAASLVHARKAKSERIAKRYDDLAPLIRQLAADGLCGREIAAELNRRGVRSTWGREWKSSAMYTALRRAQIATGSNAAARDARRTGSRLTRKARVALFIAPLLWRHYSAVGRFEDVAEALNREGHRTPRGGSWCKGAIADYLTITEFTPVPDKDLSIPLRAAVRERRVARQLAKMAIMEAAEQVWACRIKGLSGSEIVTVLSSEGIDVRLAQETCGYVAMVVKNSGVTRGRFSRRRSVMLREQS